MRPYAKRLIKAQRGLEKRDGPAIGAGIDMTNADNRKSRLRERNRRRKAGRFSPAPIPARTAIMSAAIKRTLPELARRVKVRRIIHRRMVPPAFETE
jgi:hypothetical protein